MNNENQSEEIGAETVNHQEVDPRIIEQIKNIETKTVKEEGAIADLNAKVSALEKIVTGLVQQLEKTHLIHPSGPEES